MMARFTLLSRRILFLFLFMLLLSNGYSQKVWTLEDCITYALENNLNIKKQVLNVESSKVQLLQSWVGMLPSLNANMNNYWNFGQTVDRYTNSFATSNVRSNNFSISTGVTLFSGLTMTNTVRQKNINLLASNYDLDVLKNDISLAVAGYYLDILFNSELYDVARNQHDVTLDQVARIKKMVDAGSSAKGDLLNIQAQLAAEELTVVDAENRLYISKISLQQVIDLPVTKDFVIEKPNLKPVEAPKDAMSPEVIYGYALNARPEIKSADLRVQSAEKSLAIARGMLYPSLTFGATWATGYSGASMEIDPNIPITYSEYFAGFANRTGFANIKDSVFLYSQNAGYKKTSFWDQLTNNNNKSIGFNLSIPIFNGWQGRTAINNAKILRSQAELDLEIKKRDLRKSIEQSYADAVAALKKFKASGEKVAAQTESYKYAQQKFEVGMLTSFDFNTAKKDLTKAESDLLQAKYDFIFKTTILDFYMGKPITINKQ